MNTILALAGKDLRLLLRDRIGFFFVFFFPLAYAVFFGTLFSGESGGMSAMNIVVVDEDQTEASRAFLGKLAEAEELSVTRGKRPEAEDQVRRGEKVAYVVVPAGFGAARDRMFQGEGLCLEVGVDPTRKAEAGMLQGVLTQHAFEVLQHLFQDRGAMQDQARKAIQAVRTDAEMDAATRAGLARFFAALDRLMTDLPEEAGAGKEPGKTPGGGWSWQPVRVEIHDVARERRGPKSSFDITLPQAFVWVFIGCAAAFAISLVTERTRGTLLRLRCAPVGLTQILCGKALACFVTILAALVLLYIIFSIAFEVRPDSYPHLALAIVASTLAFVGIMMLISVMGKTEASVGGIGWAFLLIMAMAGGGMLPLMFMPSWMQTVSHFSFVKWTVLAMEGAVWRNFSTAEMMLPCGILLGIGAVSFFLGARVFRITAR